MNLSEDDDASLGDDNIPLKGQYPLSVQSRGFQRTVPGITSTYSASTLIVACVVITKGSAELCQLNSARHALNSTQHPGIVN